MSSNIAPAVSLDEASFVLRFQSAVSRLPRYPDVAGTAGASAAGRWASSINPAATEWFPVAGAANLSYTGVQFESGVDLHVASQAFAWKTGDFGTFQPALVQVWSNRQSTRQNQQFELDAYLAELQWARRVDATAVGINLNYLYSQIDFASSAGPVVGSRSDRYDLRAGVLHELTESSWVGLVAEYGISPIRTQLFGTSIVRDTNQLLLLRPGIAVEYAKNSILYFDYQYGVFWDDTGTLNTHTFQIGTDYRLADPFYIRAGTVLDTEGNISGAAGFGLWLNEQLIIDVGYQYNNLPQLRREFGRAHLITAGITVFF